jgi:hypothetical protein
MYLHSSCLFDLQNLDNSVPSTPDKLGKSFAPQAIHSVPDGFVERSETNAQTDQFLGGVLCSHHPALFIFPDSNVKEKRLANGGETLYLRKICSQRRITYEPDVQGKDQQCDW